jgi:hypothetical protein
MMDDIPVHNVVFAIDTAYDMSRDRYSRSKTIYMSQS